MSTTSLGTLAKPQVGHRVVADLFSRADACEFGSVLTLRPHGRSKNVSLSSRSWITGFYQTMSAFCPRVELHRANSRQFGCQTTFAISFVARSHP